MSKPRRKLIERYDIPISHLDFGYIKTCKNAREMEKIVQILRSGEEGYFMELTKCAEEQLQKLDPNSKCFRYETPIVTKDCVEKTEWKTSGEPFVEWSDEVKVKDNFLAVIANEKSPQISIPEVRGKNKKITFTKKDNEKINKNESGDGGGGCTSGGVGSSGGGVNTAEQKANRRIKSTDYRAWDKFDADTECLKMELDEERVEEENVIKKIKDKKEKPKKLITPIIKNNDILDKLTNVEKEAMSLKLKDRGNDYFRVHEYDNALNEYTKCIEIYPTSNAYNNRAITYMKLHSYKKALEDLEKCLEIDTKNIKALLRKAQSLLGLDQRRDAYAVYNKVLSIEPSNVIARSGLNDLKKQLPDLAPASATRITIEEDKSNVKEVINNKKDDKKVPEKLDEKKSKQNIHEFITSITKTDNLNEGESQNKIPVNEIKINENGSQNKVPVNDTKNENNPQDDIKINENESQNKIPVNDTKNEKTPQNEIGLNEKSVQNNTENIITESTENSKVNPTQQVVEKTDIPNTKNIKKDVKSATENKSKNLSSEKSLENKEKIIEKKSNKSTALTDKKKINKKLEDDDYVQEDLAKLIIPKRIVKSKLAKTLDMFKNNNMPLPLPKMNQQANDKSKKSKDSTSNQMEIKLLPDKPKGNQNFIKQITK